MEKRFLEVSSFVLFLFGLSLIEPVTTGAVIGASSSSVIGILLVLVSGILFVAGEGLEEKMKYDPIIKSFRRWLEKREHEKISNEEAERLYKKFEQKYWKSVNMGVIQKSDKHKPLEYIEDFIEDFKKPNETYEDVLYRTEAQEILNEAGQSLLDRKIYTRTNDLVRLAQRCGYDTSTKRKEGTLVKKEDNSILTSIPNSPTTKKILPEE